MNILTLDNIDIYYKRKNKINVVVRNFNLKIDDGEIVALVGKSGIGKTTIAKTIMGLHKHYSGNICCNINKEDIQYIFQDPYSSLNPFVNISYIISEGMKFNSDIEKDKRIIEILKLVELDESKRFCYPSDFSGGERQKIAIARAIIRSPKLIIADEITSSIDYFSKISIINLLHKLQREQNFACLLISHDLEFIYKLTDKIVSLT